MRSSRVSNSMQRAAGRTGSSRRVTRAMPLVGRCAAMRKVGDELRTRQCARAGADSNEDACVAAICDADRT